MTQSKNHLHFFMIEYDSRRFTKEFNDMKSFVLRSLEVEI